MGSPGDVRPADTGAAYAGFEGGSDAPSPARRARGPSGRPRRPVRRTSWSCWPTTSGTPTSAATAREIDTPNLDALAAARPAATRTSTSRRCARRRVPRCSPGCEPAPRRRRHRRPRRPGVPRLRHGAGRRRRDDGRDPPRRSRLRHDGGRQVAPRQGLRLLADGAAALVAAASGASTGTTASSTRSRTCTTRTGSSQDNHPVEVDRYPDGYYFTDDITDRAISMIRERKAANPAQPFFLLLRPRRGARAAARASRGHRASYRGRYDAGLGRAARPSASPASRSSGVIPPAWTPLPRATPSATTTCSAWDDLTGRRAGALRPAHGGLRRRWSTASTRTSDACSPRSTSSASSTTRSSCSRPTTAASREGEEVGTQLVLRAPAPGRRRRRRPRPHRPARRAADHAALPAWLGDGVEHAVPPLQDQHPRRVGTRCRSSCRGPSARRRRGAGGFRAPVQPRHRCAADAAATCSGIDPPGRARRRRRCCRSPARSFAPTLGDADTPAATTAPWSEMDGHRGYYRDGWEIVTLHQPLTPFDDDEWELYDLTTDPTELRRPRAAEPERLAGR